MVLKRIRSFNRTSLELKPLSSWLVVAQFIAPLTLLIRTSLELKPLSSWLVVAQFIAPLTLLIRTSLELKRAHVPLLHMCAYLLLIAPVWN